MPRPRRPPPVARSPARAQGPAAAATPRQASPARPRRGRRLRVQSPSLASARRGPAPAHAPPPATPPLRWPGDAVAPRQSAGSGAAASVRRIAAALWRAHPPPREPGEARRRPEVSLLSTRDPCALLLSRVLGHRSAVYSAIAAAPWGSFWECFPLLSSGFRGAAVLTFE